MKVKVKNPGMGIEVPKKTCIDIHCPFHGKLKLHGKVFIGKIIKRNPNKTVNVEWSRINYIEKYERYSKKRSRVKAHNPECIDAKEGETVKIIETRPISKTKTFVVVGVEQ